MTHIPVRVKILSENELSVTRKLNLQESFFCLEFVLQLWTQQEALPVGSKDVPRVLRASIIKSDNWLSQMGRTKRRADRVIEGMPYKGADVLTKRRTLFCLRKVYAVSRAETSKDKRKDTHGAFWERTHKVWQISGRYVPHASCCHKHTIPQPHAHTLWCSSPVLFWALSYSHIW